ncbi:MAG: enoyl-CoA hydratase/isomerase family protein [Dehalococcoidia bacterium]
MAYKTVIYQRDGNIARITFNRPEKLNSWDFPGQGGMFDEFHAALTEAEDDDDIKVVIIKGAGRCFYSGHDLTTVGYVYGMGTGKPGERRASQRIRLRVDRKWLEGGWGRLFYFPKITIAQVHGYCIGEGVGLALCCDIAIAADDAQIGHTEQRLGFAGSGVGTMAHLMLAIGIKRARELLLTGRLLSGQEAAEIGLVAKSVPADKLEEEVESHAQAMALLPRDGIAIGKAFTHLVYDSLGLTNSFISGYIGHTMFTNLRWEDDEYNFLKERRNKGAKAGFHGRDARYAGLV